MYIYVPSSEFFARSGTNQAHTAGFWETLKKNNNKFATVPTTNRG